SRPDTSIQRDTARFGMPPKRAVHVFVDEISSFPRRLTSFQQKGRGSAWLEGVVRTTRSEVRILSPRSNSPFRWVATEGALNVQPLSGTHFTRRMPLLLSAY